MIEATETKRNRYMTKESSGPSYVWLIIAPILVVVFLLLRNQGIEETKNVIAKGIETSCTISRTSAKWLDVTYIIDDRPFTFTTDAPYTYLQDGEQYRIKYLKEDPDGAVILFDQPIFSSESEYGITPVSFLEDQGSRWRFGYKVNGENFTRIQLKGDSTNVADDSMVVKFDVNNRAIGYLIKRE